LNQVSELPLGSVIDVIAIIKDPGECMQITLKSGEPKSKRSLHVYDESMAAIEIVKKRNSFIILLKDHMGRYGRS